MLNIKIITVGKLKENYWLEAQNEYLKRLKAFAKIDFLQIKEEPFGTKNNFDIIKEKEATKIINKVPQNCFLIVLDKEGEKISSRKLSARLEKLKNNQISQITVVIGGPLGLTMDFKKKANLILSLSDLTFTHQMSRIIFLEQLYRAFMIEKNQPYHY